MITQILQIDQHLFRLINEQWISSWMDAFMPFISDPSPFLPFLGGGTVILLLWGGLRGRLFVLLMALALLIGDAGINQVIKHAAHRPRPYQAMEGVRVVKREGITVSGVPTPGAVGNSFTSGHACNNVALAFMACMVYGRSAALLWAWAALISYSRLYTGAHYPTDILAAWLIAPLYSWLIVRGVDFFWQRFGRSCFPRWYANYPILFPSC